MIIKKFYRVVYFFLIKKYSNFVHLTLYGYHQADYLKLMCGDFTMFNLLNFITLYIGERLYRRPDLLAQTEQIFKYIYFFGIFKYYI